MPDFNRSLLESYLDNDTVLKVIEHLDSYSIINFLHAFPRFKNLAVIVTDHHKPQPLFFRIDGVERVHITDYTESQPVEIVDERGPDCRTLAKSNLRVQRFTTSRPIRLFEFALMDTEEYMDSILRVMPSQEKLARDQPFYFNSTSFVFLCPNYYRDLHPMDVLTRRLDEFTDAKWHVGWSPYLNDECVIMSKSLSLPVTELRLIKNLCLKDVPVLESLYLPELERLSLIYQETRAPVVRSIVAPKLTKLIVHYNHQVPQFSKMSVSTTEQDEEHCGEREDVLANMYLPHGFYYGPDFEELDDLRVFELAHIGSMTKSTIPLNQCSESDYNDFSFLRKFQIVHLFGVPDSFFHSADFSNMWKLRWDIADQPHLEEPILAPNLGMLALVVRNDGILLPSFNMIEGGLTSAEWHIMMLGLNTNASNLWNSQCDVEQHYMTGLCIYNSPRLLKRNGAPVLELASEDWIGVMRLLGRTHALRTIELIGFKMPFLSVQSDEVLREHIWGSYSVNKVIFRPVVDIESEHGNYLNLNAVYLNYPLVRGSFLGHTKRPRENLQLVISPIVVNRSEEQLAKLIFTSYPYHIGPLICGKRHEAPRTLSISLGGEVSSLCLLDGHGTALVNLSPELCDLNAVSIPLNVGDLNTELVGCLRRGRKMECDWFFYAK